jgi:hypothetical protein
MRTVTRRALSIAATSSLSAMLAGCGDFQLEEDIDKTDAVEEEQSPLVSGASRVTSGTDGSSESEAVITITTDPTGTPHTIVTANADHPEKIIFSDSGTPGVASDDTRTINRNSSQMVLYSRPGLSGSYPLRTRILPPDGGALWGDPAIASYGQYVFASSLHIPIGKFPTNGVSRFAIVQTNNERIDEYLAGACIARSLDYGGTWSMGTADCAYDEGHFYDGGAVAVNSQGKVFAAFNDVDAFQIDVWRTDGPTGAIYQTNDPFPGKSMDSHPRMKFASDGHAYLMAIDTSNNLWLNHYANRAWQTPTLVASGVTYYNKVVVNNVSLRQGPGFDFSVYTSPFDGSIQIAFVYTKIVNGKSVLQSGGCNASSGTWSCVVPAGATSNPAVDCFNPAIATGWYAVPHGSSVPSTKITYQRTISTGDKVALHVSPANFSTTVVRVSGWQVPCPDYRGYWGDYDSMVAAADGFHRVFSDSTGAACVRQNYTTSPLGVSEAVIPIPPT